MINKNLVLLKEVVYAITAERKREKRRSSGYCKQNNLATCSWIYEFLNTVNMHSQ